MTNVKDRAELLLHHAQRIVKLVAEEGIQLPISIKLDTGAVYLARGYRESNLRVDVSWEEAPKEEPCDSASVVASALPEQQ